MNSSLNLNILTNNSVLANHLRLANARLLILECQYHLAELSLVAVRNETPFALYHFSQFAIDLEIAYCQYKQGVTEGAVNTLSRVGVKSFSELDIDDQLAAVDILSKMAGIDSRFGSYDLISNRKSEVAAGYTRSRAELKAGLERFTAERQLGGIVG
jgi:hypothetical protein